MNEISYRESIDQARMLQIRAVCRDLPQACGDFIRAIAMTTGTFTRLAYALDLRTFFHYLHAERITFGGKKVELYEDEDLARLSAKDLTAYTEYLQYYIREDDLENDRPRSFINHEIAIKRKLCSVRAFYDYLFQEQRIPANVTLLVPLPKIHEKPIIRLNPDEVRRILNAAETGDGLTDRQQSYQKLTAKRDYALMMLFLGTGIRVSECVGINLQDVDFDERAFVVTRKGGNQVVLYFPPDVGEALQDYYQERIRTETVPGHENAFFLSLQKRRITVRAVQNLVKKYAAVSAPLKTRISPHKLRSTFATNLYQETGDIYLVADVLGHSSVDTTRKHYADMTDARRRMAAGHVHLTDRDDEPQKEDRPDPTDG
ncbi:MAG: tyrosine-type recombinase/integrase [Clostridia bacterium]|nr:tyrosine-type recombinase/integrase [Clostridia bacterium]